MFATKSVKAHVEYVDWPDSIDQIEQENGLIITQASPNTRPENEVQTFDVFVEMQMSATELSTKRPWRE
jgi:hypothetical protein